MYNIQGDQWVRNDGTVYQFPREQIKSIAQEGKVIKVTTDDDTVHELEHDEDFWKRLNNSYSSLIGVAEKKKVSQSAKNSKNIK